MAGLITSIAKRFLCLLLVCLVLVGCGEQQAEDDPQEEIATSNDVDDSQGTDNAAKESLTDQKSWDQSQPTACISFLSSCFPNSSSFLSASSAKSAVLFLFTGKASGTRSEDQHRSKSPGLRHTD